MSTESDDLTKQIIENASSPQRVTGDAGSVESIPLSQQIAADQYLAAKAAAKRGGWPGRRFKIRPPNAADVVFGDQ